MVEVSLAPETTPTVKGGSAAVLYGGGSGGCRRRRDGSFVMGLSSVLLVFGCGCFDIAALVVVVFGNWCFRCCRVGLVLWVLGCGSFNIVPSCWYLCRFDGFWRVL
ncbi:hypothetical protein QL285_091158 [Trifolium repens]|nr:hypothetical protein QL285_091158 [Trifolium repens]